MTDFYFQEPETSRPYCRIQNDGGFQLFNASPLIVGPENLAYVEFRAGSKRELAGLLTDTGLGSTVRKIVAGEGADRLLIHRGRINPDHESPVNVVDLVKAVDGGATVATAGAGVAAAAGAEGVLAATALGSVAIAPILIPVAAGVAVAIVAGRAIANKLKEQAYLRVSFGVETRSGIDYPYQKVEGQHDKPRVPMKPLDAGSTIKWSDCSSFIEATS